jgi:hypothetical protein
MCRDDEALRELIAGCLDEIEPVIRAAEPGRYHIDELPLKPFLSGHTARRWGVGIKWADGSVVLEPIRGHESDQDCVAAIAAIRIRNPRPAGRARLWAA